MFRSWLDTTENIPPGDGQDGSGRELIIPATAPYFPFSPNTTQICFSFWYKCQILLFKINPYKTYTKILLQHVQTWKPPMLKLNEKTEVVRPVVSVPIKQCGWNQ